MITFRLTAIVGTFAMLAACTTTPVTAPTAPSTPAATDIQIAPNQFDDLERLSDVSPASSVG